MEKELGLFPLNIVAFPGERLNLHIFEPRYKQLVNDCLQLKTTFGIPAFIHSKIEYGTEMRILEVTKLYDDGRMDIKTQGVAIFQVIDFINPYKDRLYSGGMVRLQKEKRWEDKELNLRFIDLLRQLFEWLNIEEQIVVDQHTQFCDVIHKIGLNKEEEYELLKMNSEADRMLYAIQHIKNILPALERAEKARELIRMNGHFKHFDPLVF